MTVASTSIKVYNDEIKGSKENNQDSIILSAYVAIGKPASLRMIEEYLINIKRPLDINVISRSANNLHDPKEGKKAKIKWVEVKKCEVTGRRVNHYEPFLKLGEQTRLFI